ncbi:hypothetical protein CAPTEDRAFT_166277 [Capitella teleta]|uniref:Neurotransmitter-gated ion-channel transmembrane domain-containing protein n=1 Tax=Capitella teleta TaxID=283909 RepID=X1ZAM3_CAPTE|nr:hypothetical protein CAPTEDRAFT_166277 [Capitella teleta]|eukprot:ELT90136.1 hypothetical protein CAPTEDRAFT_166277 [Capitella teleta]
MLLNGSDVIGLDVFKKHGEWEIVNTKSFNTNQYFDSDPGIPFPTVKFVFYLKRKPKFYLINVVAPCILMSVLASLVFYLPPESGEKVSLGITVLLSFSVFLLLIAENVPKTSDCVPLIGIYLTMVMVMTGCSIVISVIVLDLHHHEAFSPVPVWLKRIVFSCMARMLCMHTPYTDAGHQSGSMHIGQTRFNRNSTRSYGNHGTLLSAGLTTDDEESVNLQQTTTQQTQQQQDNVDGMNNVVKGFYDELEALMAPRRKKPILEEMLQHLRDITNKMRKNIKKDHIKSEWKLVAKVLDRFLLILFLVSVSAFTLYILYIYPRIMMPPVNDIGP